MKTAIIGILNNPATSMNSHSSGMVNIVKELFNADILTERDNWNEYEKLIIYHGTNFRKGIYNVIGGINDNVLSRSKKLKDYNGIIETLDGFQLRDFLKKRNISIPYDDEIKEIELPKRDNLVIGDSHSISIWPDPSYTIMRMDGKTLYGFLNMNIELSSYNKKIIYFGNIDIRFHIFRQQNPMFALDILIEKYLNYCEKYNCEVVNLLPIESESRKIPTTGLHKGKKFFGTISERSEAVKYFNNKLNSSGLKTHTWPDLWYSNIIFYETHVMEPKQSVHIRPKYYKKNRYENK